MCSCGGSPGLPAPAVRHTCTDQGLIDAVGCTAGGGKDMKDPQLCMHLIYVMIKVRRAA